MKNYEKIYHKIDVAFTELASDKRVKGRALCFVGIPYSFFPTGAAQAAWMHGVEFDQPIYYDRGTFGFSHLPVYENCIKVIVMKDGFKIISTDRKKVDLCCGGIGPGCELGVSTTISEDKNYLERDFVFYKKYADQNPLIITWDYEKLRFKILN